MHTLAQELNTVLENTILGRMMSDMGKRLYFPKGIIAQSAEAKKLGKVANGTIGMAVKEGKPLILPSVQKELPNLSPAEAVAYAPTAGLPDLQSFWQKQIFIKNKSLEGKLISLPVVTPGLTAGIAYLCDLFLSAGETLLTADPTWDNYALIVEARRNGKLKQFKMFKDGGFNVEAFKTAIAQEAKTGKVRVLLNFPQNPSGYSPTTSEVKEICSVLKAQADTGTDIMVWCDDAYFGLNYEENTEKESLFAFLAGLHSNIVAVKIDGPTKEDYVWGFRSGFLTFASKDLTEQHFEALQKKLMGVIRSSVSCCASPSQSILLKAISSPTLAAEKAEFRAILEKRYQIVRAFIDSKKNHPVLESLPFNSGYFMSLRCKGINAETLRLALLEKHGIGTIAIDKEHLRVAFSSIDENLLEMVYSTIFSAAEELAKQA